MSQFLDVRLAPVGGGLATTVAVMQGTSVATYQGLRVEDLVNAIQGRHLLIGTHGFNVDRAAGLDALTNWEALLQLTPQEAFVGLLWPGDSVWAHGLDYPEEPRIANETGELVATFIDMKFAGAASISFASHSLGARVVLATIAHLTLPVRRLILMAGAIDDNCLSKEYKAAVANIGEISVLASKKDEVLSAAFPLGNFFAGIIAEGHPWWRAALGHCGPVRPQPATFRAPYEIPKSWNYGHGDYLAVCNPPPAAIPTPTTVPPPGTPALAAPCEKTAWSASFVSTRFR